MSESRQEGGCRCGKVRFAVTGSPLITAACHCTGCQRMTASAFSLSSGYPDGSFEIIAGEPVIGGLHGEQRHHHCDFCKSWLFTRMAGMGFVNVRTTMLDQAPAEPPFVETWRSEALPWATTGAAHSFDRLPGMEEWPRLTAEFAEQRPAGSNRRDGDQP